MIPDLEIWRAANLLIKRYGDKAQAEATARAEALADAGDPEGCRLAPDYPGRRAASSAAMSGVSAPRATPCSTAARPKGNFTPCSNWQRRSITSGRWRAVPLIAAQCSVSLPEAILTTPRRCLPSPQYLDAQWNRRSDPKRK